MFHSEMVRGPFALTGPINVELGTVAVVLRKNELAEVLGPGRYSKTRLALMGILPVNISVFIIRTALSRFTADCSNVRLGDSQVDLRAVVQVRMRLNGDLNEFFANLMRSYGTDFGAQAPIIAQQLVEEALQEVGADRGDAQTSTRKVRTSLSAVMEPSHIFEIVDVLSLTVTRDDPISVQAEIDERLRPLERARRLNEVQLAADEGELRAAACMQLASKLGVDPLYLWDPVAFREDTNAQRQALVQLVGQYGENLAILAEATNMNADVLGAVLGPLLPTVSARSGSNLPSSANLSGFPASTQAVLGIDPELKAFVGDLDASLMGGVLRTADFEGKRLTLLLAVTTRSAVDELRATLVTAVDESTVLGVFDGEVPVERLARSVISWVTGSAADDVSIARAQGQLVWRLPPGLTEDASLAEFAVETVCDLFESPALLPVLN